MFYWDSRYCFCHFRVSVILTVALTLFWNCRNCFGICSRLHHCNMHRYSRQSIPPCHTPCRHQSVQMQLPVPELVLGCSLRLLLTQAPLCHLYQVIHLLACTLQHQWHQPRLHQKDLALYQHSSNLSFCITVMAVLTYFRFQLVD